MSYFWTVTPPTKHIKELCKALGSEYRITDIDLERVIYRDFGNGYDVEISGMNTSSNRKKARIYLWKDKRRIIKIVDGVPQDSISEWVKKLHSKVLSLIPSDFGDDSFLLEPRNEYAL